MQEALNDVIVRAFKRGTYGKFGLTFEVENGIFTEAVPITKPRLRLPKGNPHA